MRKARNYWEETCAVLAILVGLTLNGMSWADTFQWFTNTGPTETTYKCNASTSSWDCTGNFSGTSCVSKGSPGNPGANITLFECGNSIWNGVKATQIKTYGQCNTSSGSCTYWAQYWCVAWNVYKDTACSTFACSYQGSGPNYCDPSNPTGQ